MKTYFFVVVALHFFLVSCHDTIDQPARCPPETDFGTITAMVTDTIWDACVYAKESNKFFYIDGNYFHPVSLTLYQNVSIYLPKKIGRYPMSSDHLDLDGRAFADWHEKDYDSTYAGYDSRIGNSNEYVEITGYDSLTQHIQGKFNFTLYKVWQDPYYMFPDSIVIRDGYFDTYIIE